MQNALSIRKVLFGMTVFCLFSAVSFAQTPALQNASFDNFISASDSFPSWKTDKDSTNGQKFIITQETSGAYSAPGCLKMAITPGADTTIKCTVSGSVSGLTPNRLVKITGMVKYSDMPTYYNAMISLDQATCVAPDWNWVERKWGTLWGNNQGTSDWTSFTVTDTIKDSANVFTFNISIFKAGTLWVDDIAIAFADDPVIQKTVQPARQGLLVNNRIVFLSVIPYTLEAFDVNGKIVLKSSATAKSVDLNHLNLQDGAYLVRVTAAGKIWSGKVLTGK
jgi:hypothetical protein